MKDFSPIAGWHRYISEDLLQRARELRQQQTPAEQILWECLCSRRLSGAKFRRQHNIGCFIADFYCHEARFVVELDGDSHLAQVQQNAERDAWMTANGLTVLRFENARITTDLTNVLTEIINNLSKPLALRERGLG